MTREQILQQHASARVYQERFVALTGAQYDAVGEPLLPVDRDAFLRALAAALRGEAEIGDGTVARAIRQLQREFWQPAAEAGAAVTKVFN